VQSYAMLGEKLSDYRCPPSAMGGMRGWPVFPTTDSFSSPFGEAALHDAVRRSNSALIPHRLAIHVRAPRRVRHHTGPRAGGGASAGELYVERLIRQIERLAPLFDRDRDVVELEIEFATGVIGCAEVLRLESSLGRHFSFAPLREREFRIAFQGLQFSSAEIRGMPEAGFDRARLSAALTGTQPVAANDGRSLPEAINECRLAGFRHVDVILRLEHAERDTQSVGEALAEVLAMRPARLLLAQDGPSRLADTVRRRLEQAAYVMIGPDHFAAGNDSLITALAAGRLGMGPAGYMAAADCDVLGLGVGAVSRVGDVWWRNLADPNSWDAAADSARLPLCCGIVLDVESCMRRDIIRDLLCHLRIDILSLEQRYGIDFHGHFAAAVTRLRRAEADGQLTMSRDEVRVTRKGHVAIRDLAEAFVPPA